MSLTPDNPRAAQLIHPSWFLSRYKNWWATERLSCVADFEFGVLLLRICSYASLFLPSPSHTIDTIRGMSLADIRTMCDDAADDLVKICSRADQRGSLVRVQHLCFSGLRFQCEGKNDSFWNALSETIKVAQRIGIHRDSAASVDGMDELEKEMRRRTFCNLYVWDSLLSRQLDCVPFLSGASSTNNPPQMHLVSEVDDQDAPDCFMERVLEAHLADFWKDSFSGKDAEYNITEGEERYERFHNEFLRTFPPAYALQPNVEWDKRFPKLRLQRQLLHITIFESICWNFRPALLLDPSRCSALPAYKRVLLSSQKRTLAAAALSMLDNVSVLHGLLGGSHTRFASVIFPTFEAAVLLICLCADPNFLCSSEDSSRSASKWDPFGIGVTEVTRSRCEQAVHEALNRLRMLAEVSHMAEVGIRTLDQLVSRTTSTSPVPTQPSVEVSGFTPLPEPETDDSRWLLFERSDSVMDDFSRGIASNMVYQNWEMFGVSFDSL